MRESRTFNLRRTGVRQIYEKKKKNGEKNKLTTHGTTGLVNVRAGDQLLQL